MQCRLPAAQITLLADETGGMTRMLGLDIPPEADGSGPRSQRWAGSRCAQPLPFPRSSAHWPVTQQ